MFSVINRECFDTDHHNSCTDWDKYVGEKDVYSTYDLEHVDLSKFNQSKNKIIRTAIKRRKNWLIEKQFSTASRKTPRFTRERDTGTNMPTW